MKKADNSHRDVMVSSTSRDLPIYREKAKDAVWRAGLYAQMMEKDTAMNRSAVEYSLGLVDTAEAYVGIFAHRYGFIPEGSDISITEMEYRRAKERRIPMLIFLLKEDYAIPVTSETKDIYFESDSASAEKLKKLKGEMKNERVVGFFTTPEDLSDKIFQALIELKKDGIFDEDIAAVPQLADERESKLPEPPEPFIAHPYILTRRFFGRVNELKLIDDWAQSENPVLIFEAIGGMGKSALTWYWFHQHARKQIPRLAGAIWWSFYESDGSMPNFLKHALAYVTDTKPADYDKTPLSERKRLLVDVLRQKPYLLVLDGIERILVAYHRMDAPTRSDEQVDEEAREAKDDANLRSCTDPQHGEVLMALASCTPSKILISTRLKPHDLEDKSRRLIPGVSHHALRGIYPPEEALGLLHHLGVTGTQESIMRFTRQFDNHALLLNVIAGFVTNYRPAPGDFDGWYADEGKNLKLRDMNVSQRRTQILKEALNGLEREQEQLLARLSAFRYPVEYAAVKAVNTYLPPAPEPVNEPNHSWLDYLRRDLESANSDEERADLQKQIADAEVQIVEQQARFDVYQTSLKSWSESDDNRRALRLLNSALDALEDRGLLQWDRLTNRYDLHPVVRAYAFERLSESERSDAFALVRDYFRELPPEDHEHVNELDDLRRSLEIYNALIGAAMLEQAADFYIDNLRQFLLYELNAYHAVLELLRPLFPGGFTTMPALSSPRRTGLVISEVIAALKYIGLDRQAIALAANLIKFDLDEENVFNVRVGLNNYAVLLSDLNHVAAADSAENLAYSLARAVDDSEEVAMAEYYRFLQYVERGLWSEAEAAYERFMARPPVHHFQAAQLRAWAAGIYARMMISRGEQAGEYLDEAERWAVVSRDLRTQAIVIASRGEMAMRAGAYSDARTYLQNALAIFRKIGRPQYDICARLALVSGLMGDAEAARDWLAQALEKIDYEATVISIAETYLAIGNREEARKHALIGYKRGWADGPPYIRWSRLEHSRRVLAALGETDEDAIQRELGLIPFDPSKVEPIPYEDEILTLIEKLKQGEVSKTDSNEPQ